MKSSETVAAPEIGEMPKKMENAEAMKTPEDIEAKAQELQRQEVEGVIEKMVENFDPVDPKVLEAFKEFYPEATPEIMEKTKATMKSSAWLKRAVDFGLKAMSTVQGPVMAGMMAFSAGCSAEIPTAIAQFEKSAAHSINQVAAATEELGDATAKRMRAEAKAAGEKGGVDVKVEVNEKADRIEHFWEPGSSIVLKDEVFKDIPPGSAVRIFRDDNGKDIIGAGVIDPTGHISHDTFESLAVNMTETEKKDKKFRVYVIVNHGEENQEELERTYLFQ